MKKILALSLFVLVALVYAKPCTSGGTAVLCNWGDGKCWQIKSTDNSNAEVGCDVQVANCESGGTLYKGTEKSDGSCSGATPFTCGGCSLEGEASIYCDYGPLTSSGGGCYEKPVGQCTGGTEVTKQQCDDRMNAGVATDVVWCDFGAANEYGDGGCYEKTPEECEASSGTVVSSCPGGNPPPITVLKFTPASQALIVAPFGRSLHISSARDATVSLYDMSGAKVYSGKVRAGNSVFSLERVSSGSYYAVVQSGSDAKKVPVVLK